MPVLVQLSDVELAAARKKISEYSGWFVGIGVLLMLVGLAAIAFPLLSTIATAIWIGWALLLGGVLMLFHAVGAWQWPDSAWSIVIGLLYLCAGASILYAPLAGVISLTIVVAALFFTEGVIEIVMAFRLRPINGWGWWLFSGVAALVAGALIAYQLPSSAAWALGLLFGMNVLSTGISLIMVAFACRQAAQGVPSGLGRTA